jgi:hypothetical protein
MAGGATVSAMVGACSIKQITQAPASCRTGIGNRRTGTEWPAVGTVIGLDHCCAT